MTPHVRLLVVDHHPRTRYALERLLDAEPGFAVVAQWVNGSDTVRLADQHRPDVLLLDLDMPGTTSVVILNGLVALRHHVRTLGLCADVQSDTILHVLDVGGHGVIDKGSPKEILFRSIRTVAAGHYWVPPEHVAVLIERLRTQKRVPDARPQPSGIAKHRARFRLTRRELDIVAGVALGESNKEIAERLSVKECTVKHHLSSVFDKVGVFSRLQLAVFAIHHHLVEMSDYVNS
jgi:two-component system, NarL family, nitrate/nitrite response regulator NarL